MFVHTDSIPQPSGRNEQRPLSLVRRQYPERHLEGVAIVDAETGVELRITPREWRMLQVYGHIPGPDSNSDSQLLS